MIIEYKKSYYNLTRLMSRNNLLFFENSKLFLENSLTNRHFIAMDTRFFTLNHQRID